MKALKSIFPESTICQSIQHQSPHWPWTISLQHHGGRFFCCLALKGGFLPGSANVSEPDPETGPSGTFAND